MQSNFNIDTSSLDADAFTAAGETIEDRLEEADLGQMQQEDPEAFAQETGGPDAGTGKETSSRLEADSYLRDDNDPRKDGVGSNKTLQALPDILAETDRSCHGGGFNRDISWICTTPGSENWILWVTC